MPDKENPNAQEEENRQQEQENQEAAQTEEEREEEENEEEEEEEESETAAPSQTEDGQTESAQETAAAPKPKARRRPRREPGVNELYDKIHEDKALVRESGHRIASYSDEIEAIDSEEKKNAAHDKLLKEREIIENVKYRAESRYPEESENFSERYKNKAAERIGALSRLTDKVQNQYQEKRDRIDAVDAEYQIEALRKRVEGLDEQRIQMEKANRGKQTLKRQQYRALKYQTQDLMADYNRLPAPKSPKGERMMKTLNTYMDWYNTRLKQLESAMPQWERTLLKREEESAQGEAAQLNRRYTARNPLIRLLYKVMQIKDKRRPEKSQLEEAKEVYGKAKDEKDAIDEIRGDAEDMGSSIRDMAEGTFFNAEEDEEEEEGGLKDWLFKHAKLFLSWISGKTGNEQVEKIGGRIIDELSNWFDPVLNAIKLIKNMKKFSDKVIDMSGEEVNETVMEIAGQTFDVISSGLKAVQRYIGEIPLLGEVMGIISSVMGIINHSIRFATKNRLRKTAKAEKEKLKEKRNQYAMQEETRDLGLYSFMGTATVGEWRGKGRLTAHVQKDNSAKRKWGKHIKVSADTTIETQKALLERQVGQGDIHTQLEEMKQQKNRGQLDAAQRRKYFQMKALRDMRQYQELKEAKHVNVKRLREEALELVDEGAGLAAGIAGLFPGIGTAVSKGIKFGQLVMGLIRKSVTFFHKKYQNAKGITKRKEQRNNAMASNIFQQMLFVGGYLRPNMEDTSTPLFSVGPESAKRVSSRMEYLDNITSTLSYKMSEMQDVETRDELLDMMAAAFTTAG